MNSFIFALSAVAPIVLTVALGYFLKRIGIIPIEITKALNRIVFRVLLPVMVFLNIYEINNTSDINMSYVAYSIGAIMIIFIISLPLVNLLTNDRTKKAPLIQAVFRSNYTLVGIPLSEALFPESGARIASLLCAFTIPIFNILAVLLLSYYGHGEKRISIKKVCKDIMLNPLIIAVSLGLIVLLVRYMLVMWSVDFRLSNITPLHTVLRYLANASTPLALLVLGAQFEFKTARAMKKEIIFGTLLRTIAVPVLGLGIAATAFDFEGAHYAAFIALFCTPTAVSSVPMAQEMGSDAELAGQLVIWSTIVSGFTMFLFSFLLKEFGFLQ